MLREELKSCYKHFPVSTYVVKKEAKLSEEFKVYK